MKSSPPEFFLGQSQIKPILDKLGVSLSKKYGQNFLVSWPSLSRIVELCNLKNDEKILEIGPGLGSLTFPIASTVKSIECIEINPTFKKFLEDRSIEFNQLNVNVISGDALSINFPSDIDKVISATPYSISGPLTSRIAQYMEQHPVPAYLICQKEFGMKLLAKPDTMDYSRLSANISLVASTKKLMDISRNNFHPVPRVDSVLVKLTPIRREVGCDYNEYRNLTRHIFPLKNKTISHALKLIGKQSNQLEKVKACLEGMKKTDRRVRALAPEDIVELVLLLKESGVKL